LNVDDCSMVFHKDGQYYVNDGGATYYPTCVAYSTVDDASCDYLTYVCGACLGTTYGTYEAQGILLAQAMAQPDYHHLSCPLNGCDSYDGFVPRGFEEKVEYTYCPSDDGLGGCYYMNGMETCVCDDSTDVSADLEYLWDNNFELSYCEDTRTFDELMTDQLWITNTMIDALETQVEGIPDVQTQLSSAQEELVEIWGVWQSEITTTINSAIDTARADGKDDLCDDLAQILTSLEELSS